VVNKEKISCDSEAVTSTALHIIGSETTYKVAMCSNTLITTVLVPALAVCWRNYVQGIKKANIDIVVRQFSHSHPY
jgi:hypothetical protein